ncbi:uncharacterized protein F4807DRAFT_434392 [Annulohypoxylon truncatum]|uniref:uncharacterized protein n=1 Tax=Annulohypoxylon truncatum TaxID=327061 RepID=UPI002007A95E|nr:uncharacterized protein F4807DRAFT_434392 [Annulohypoxylon truncatum]KAI1207736.1 hypothetical protein F4807DRAFT_434392 [Annulohypoxylon truncatum]
MSDENRTSPRSFANKEHHYSDNLDAASVADSFKTEQELYDHHAKITRDVSTTATPYRPFPPVMKAFYQWNLSLVKVFYLCGPGGEDDRLFAVEQHTGYSLSGPLGIRPGMILYDGISTKDRILAASGDESQMGCRAYTFNPNSIVLLPPRVPGSKFMVREMMHARGTGNGVAFQFSLDVGLSEEKKRRETFEWRKIMKAEKDEEAKQGGFKLLRVSSSSSKGNSSRAVLSSASLATTTTATTESGSEIFALFAWTKTISNLKHPFTLELKVDGMAVGLGETWTLAVVVTATRLWMLHMYGKTNRPVVAVSDKLRGK